MSDDICDKLVRFNERKECVSTNLEVEAADEITHLREENARLREALVSLLKVIDSFPNDIGADMTVAVRAAAAAIREGGKDD